MMEQVKQSVPSSMVPSEALEAWTLLMGMSSGHSQLKQTLTVLSLYRNVLIYDRICLLALKPKEFVYAMKQSLLGPNKDLPFDFNQFKTRNDFEEFHY